MSAKRVANELWEFDISVGQLESSFSFAGPAVALANGTNLPAGAMIFARIVGLTLLEGFPGRLAALRLEPYTGPEVRVPFRARAVRETVKKKP